VQTYEIHSPCSPPPPYRRRFVTPGERDLATRSLDLYDGSIRFDDDALRDFLEAERRRLVEEAARLQPSLRVGGELDRALVEQLRALGYAVEPGDEEGAAADGGASADGASADGAAADGGD